MEPWIQSKYAQNNGSLLHEKSGKIGILLSHMVGLLCIEKENQERLCTAIENAAQHHADWAWKQNHIIVYLMQYKLTKVYIFDI